MTQHTLSYRRLVFRGGVSVNAVRFYSPKLEKFEGAEVLVLEVIESAGSKFFVEIGDGCIPLALDMPELRNDLGFLAEHAKSREHLAQLYCAIKSAPHYETLDIGREATDVLALNLLKLLDGLTVASVREVLHRAEFWLDAVSTLNCGKATEFARAVEGLRSAVGEPL